jgi:hypothetical protein
VSECYLAHWFEVSVSEMEKRHGTHFLLTRTCLEQDMTSSWSSFGILRFVADVCSAVSE